jgi:hypothetical protein
MRGLYSVGCGKILILKGKAPEVVRGFSFCLLPYRRMAIRSMPQESLFVVRGFSRFLGFDVVGIAAEDRGAICAKIPVAFGRMCP